MIGVEEGIFWDEHWVLYGNQFDNKFHIFKKKKKTEQSASENLTWNHRVTPQSRRCERPELKARSEGRLTHPRSRQRDLQNQEAGAATCSGHTTERQPQKGGESRHLLQRGRSWRTPC